MNPAWRPLLILALELFLTWCITNNPFPAILIFCAACALRIRHAKKGWTRRILLPCYWTAGGLALYNLLMAKELSTPPYPLLLLPPAQLMQLGCVATLLHTPQRWSSATRLHYSEVNGLFVLLGMLSLCMAGALPYSVPIMPEIYYAALFGLLLLLAFQLHATPFWRPVSRHASADARSSAEWLLMLVACVAMLTSGLLTPSVLAVSHATMALLASRPPAVKKSAASKTTNPQRHTMKLKDSGRARGDPRQMTLSEKYDIDKEHIPVYWLRPSDPGCFAELRRQGLYLRNMTYDTFTDWSWSSDLTRSARLADADDGTANRAVDLRPLTSQSVAYQVYAPVTAPVIMPVIPQINRLETPIVLHIDCSVFMAPIRPAGRLFSYRAVSTPRTWRRVALLNPRPGPTGRYTQLEQNSLMTRIGRLAHSHAWDDESGSVLIERLRSYLADNFTYSTRTHNPLRLHPLENFLFNEKQGACELFSSSFALMLRTLDIPARIGVGYTGGNYDAASGIHTFYNDEAHAWTEVLFEDIGWVIVDPTPPNHAAHRPPRQRPSRTPNLSQGRDLAGMIRTADLNLNKTNSVKQGIKLLWLAPLAVLVLAALLGLALSWLKRTGSHSVLAPQTGVRQTMETLPPFMRLFLQVFAQQGLIHNRGQTIGEYSAKLKAHGLLHDECDDLLNYFHDICYGGKPRKMQRERHYSQRLRNMRKEQRRKKGKRR